MDVENKLDSARLEEILRDIIENSEISKRELKIFRGCINSPGLVEGLYDCGDKSCPGCTMMRLTLTPEECFTVPESKTDNEKVKAMFNKYGGGSAYKVKKEDKYDLKPGVGEIFNLTLKSDLSDK